MTTLYVLPEADTHCFDEDTKTDCWSFSRDLLVQEIAKAELRGRESMREEAADLIFGMLQKPEQDKYWVHLHEASARIRSLK